MTRPAPIIAAILLCVLLVAYALSAVPALTLAEQEIISWQVYDTIYAPILWLNDNCPPVHDALVKYEAWWLGR